MRLLLTSVHFFTFLAFTGAVEAGQCAIESKRGLIWADVAVPESSPLQFIVDTGAEETVLDLSAAKKLGLKMGSKETVRGVGGLSHAYRSQSYSLTCAGVRLQKSFLTLDLSPARRKTGRRVDGLLGADFFQGRTVQIDYGARQLRVLSSYSPRGGAEILPIRRNYGAMCVPVQVGEVKLPWMRIDTGSDTELLWSAPDGTQGDDPTQRSSIGFTGLVDSSGKDDVRLGSKVFPNIKTVRSSRLFPGEDGLLGNTFLNQFRVTIDMPRSRLILEPR